ncbi:MAG TPA: glycosyltransferase family 2 protein [Edaphocola sp.]|nr:glycosyltransferase family 2 protein [Edaphocola sp.]
MSFLSIVLPVYNPPENWEQHVVMACQAITNALGYPPEIIVVRDGGHKLSGEAVLKLEQSLPNCYCTGYEHNKGKGAALRFGIEKAKGEKLIYTDIDFPYTTESFLKIWEALKYNDIVIGIKDDKYYQHVPKARVVISKSLRKLIGLLLRMPVTDTQCGLKGFNRNGRTIFLQTTINRYLCDLEFVYLCFKSKKGLKVTSKAITLRADVTFRKMNPRILMTELSNFLSIIIRKAA